MKSEAGKATDPVFSGDALSRVMEPARTYKDKYAHKTKVVDDRSRPRNHVTSHATAIAPMIKHKRSQPCLSAVLKGSRFRGLPDLFKEEFTREKRVSETQ